MHARFRSKTRAAAPLSVWSKYKDVAMLVAGAIIGIMSSYVASIQQLNSQKQQVLFDQRFRVIREFIELNNSTWRKSDSLLETLSQRLEVAQKSLSKPPNNGKVGEQLADIMREFGSTTEETMKALTDEAADYEAKLDVVLTLLSYLLEHQPEHVAIDVEISGMTAEILAANRKLGAITKPTPDQSVAMAKVWLTDMSTAVMSQRERNVVQRTKINESIRAIAQNALR
jgi:hypothetical protein